MIGNIPSSVIEQSMIDAIMALYDAQIEYYTKHEHGPIATINATYKDALIKTLTSIGDDKELTTEAKNTQKQAAIQECNEEIKKQADAYQKQMFANRQAVKQALQQAANNARSATSGEENDEKDKAAITRLAQIYVAYYDKAKSPEETFTITEDNRDGTGGDGASSDASPASNRSRWSETLRQKAEENWEYFNKLDQINQAITLEELSKKLNEIAIELFQKLKSKELIEKIIWWGRYTQAHPFSAFAGTTMAGSFILIGVDYAKTEKEGTDGEIITDIDPDIVHGFAFGAIPIFLVVWMANYYITKNLSGQLLYEFFIDGKWLPQTSKESFSFICSLAATFISCVFTYYTTVKFLAELIKASAETEELQAWLMAIIIGVGAVSAIFTFITYFAVMHLFGKDISWNKLNNDLKEIGDLAIISDIPWVKSFLLRAFIKIGISIPLIILSASPLGWVLLSISVLYLLLTGINFKLSQDASNKRMAAQIQVVLLVIYCILSMAFLMYAAVDILAAIFDNDFASYVMMFLGWLGVISFYTICTIESVLNIMRKNVKEDLKEADTTTVLTEIMKEGTDDKTSTPPNRTTSLAEDNEWLMILFNGISNGLPNYYGAFEFAQTYNLAAEETYALAISAFLYSSAVSMAGNYKGIQADKTCAVEMAQLRCNLGRIQNVQHFFNQVNVAIQKLQEYQNNLPLDNTLSFWQRSNAYSRSACDKVILLLQNFQSNSSTEHDLTLDENEKKALRQGELGMIYEIYARPFVEVATAKTTVTEHENTLTALIEKVKDYHLKRDVRSNYTFGCLGSPWKLVPGFSKDDKVPAAEKLKQHLDIALRVLKRNSPTEEKVEPFTEAEQRALVDSTLGILYAEAQPYLALCEAYVNRSTKGLQLT